MRRVYERFPLRQLQRRLAEFFYTGSTRVIEEIVHSVSGVIVYGGLVAIVIAALFGIDFFYRHFA
jgi:hypothetical protein